MADKRNWNLIPWAILKQHLADKQRESLSAFEAASTLEEVWALKGELRLIRKLLNLPATLEVKFDKEEQ